MKRFLMLVAVATVAGAVYVAEAPGHAVHAGPTWKQFTALKAQVAALKKDEAQVKKLAVASVEFLGVCFLNQSSVNVKGVSQFGDPSGTYGFVYQSAPGHPTSDPASYRTALDVDGSATPQAYLQVVDPSCVRTSGAAASALAHGGSIHLPLHAERAR